MKVILSDMRHPVRAHHPETQFAPQLLRCDCRKGDRKSTRLNSSHSQISYAVFCLKKKKLCSSDRKSTRLNSSHSQISYAVSLDRKSTRLNSSHSQISYAVFCLQKKKENKQNNVRVCT